MEVGSADGFKQGLMDGLTVGTLELGRTVPTHEGLIVCFKVGMLVGTRGLRIGSIVAALGTALGSALGMMLGVKVGTVVGREEG